MAPISKKKRRQKKSGSNRPDISKQKLEGTESLNKNETGINKSIREAAHQSHLLFWSKSSSDQYELVSEGSLLARLHVGFFGNLTSTESVEGKWVITSNGLINSTIAIRLAQTDDDVARLRVDGLSGHHMVEYSDGTVFQWKRGDSMNNLAWTAIGGFLLSSTTWALSDKHNSPVVAFKNYQVVVKQKIISKLTSVVLLGSYLMIRALEYSDNAVS